MGKKGNMKALIAVKLLQSFFCHFMASDVCYHGQVVKLGFVQKKKLLLINTLFPSCGYTIEIVSILMFTNWPHLFYCVCFNVDQFLI